MLFDRFGSFFAIEFANWSPLHYHFHRSIRNILLFCPGLMCRRTKVWRHI